MFFNPFKHRKKVHIMIEIVLYFIAFYHILSDQMPYFFLSFSLVFLNRFIEKPHQKSNLLMIAIFFLGFIK